MSQQKLCQECNQRHQCQEVYRQLGKAQGPSVVFKVIVAFLLPLVVFIAALAIFEEILSGFEIAAGLRAVFSMAASLLVTTLFVLIIRASKPPNKFGDKTTHPINCGAKYKHKL